MLGHRTSKLLHLGTLPQEEMECISLERGRHKRREEGLCSLEAMAWLAGEPHSDTPECVCPVIREFITNWNDLLGDTDRDRLLKPLLPHLARTNLGPETELDRHARNLDWLMRRNLPSWLEIAGLDRHAQRLARFRPITAKSHPAQLVKAAEILERVRGDAEKARRQIPGTQEFMKPAEEAVIISGNPAVERWGPDGPGRLKGSWMLEAADRIAEEAAAVIAGMASAECPSEDEEERRRAALGALERAAKGMERSAQAMVLNLARETQIHAPGKQPGLPI